MNRQRIKNKINLNVWPFKKEDTAKLYWIDEPYQDVEKRWKLPLYFQKIPTKEIKRCDVDWGTLPVLRIGRLYKGGNLLTDMEQIPTKYRSYYNMKQMQVDCDAGLFSLKKRKHKIITLNGVEHRVSTKAFSATINGLDVHIPAIEIMRSILTTNRKLVYAILQPNALDYYFLIRKRGRGLKDVIMEFTKEYPGNLLTEQHIIHLLWLSINERAKLAWNEVSKNILKGDGLQFPFPFNSHFSIQGRCRKQGNIVRMEEVMQVKGYEIDVKRVEVISPYFKNVSYSRETKKRKLIYPNDQQELQIEQGEKEARKLERTIEIPNAKFIFNQVPNIHRKKQDSIIYRINEDEKTEKVLVKNTEKVTTSDLGSTNQVKGLEFQDKEEIIHLDTGDLQEYILILQELEKRYENISVMMQIQDLPSGKKKDGFSKLSDGITRRKYLMAEIVVDKERVFYLMDVQRSGKSLAALLFSEISSRQKNRELIFKKILQGLVDNNGNWDQKLIEKIWGFHRYSRLVHTKLLRVDRRVNKLCEILAL